MVMNFFILSKMTLLFVNSKSWVSASKNATPKREELFIKLYLTVDLKDYIQYMICIWFGIYSHWNWKIYIKLHPKSTILKINGKSKKIDLEQRWKNGSGHFGYLFNVILSCTFCAAVLILLKYKRIGKAQRPRTLNHPCIIH